MDSAVENYVEKYAERRAAEERNMLIKIVGAVAAGKDNETIIRELNCTLEQIIPIRTAMGK